jgi:hypothetical protein
VEVLQVLEQLAPVVHQDVHDGRWLVGVGHKHLTSSSGSTNTPFAIHNFE